MRSINFEDTYDGLGDALEEENDDFNDDTFGGGGGGSTGQNAGRDFDFFGNTSKVSDAINEEAVRFSRHQATQKPVAALPTSRAAKRPFKTGYEAYKDPVHVANLQADPSLWGTAPAVKAPTQQTQSKPEIASQQPIPASKKMMSLEEIESMMFAPPASLSSVQTQVPSYTPSHPFANQIPQSIPSQAIPTLRPDLSNIPFLQQQQVPDTFSRDLHSTRRPQQSVPVAQISRHESRPSQTMHAELPAQTSPALPGTLPPPGGPQILQRPVESRQPLPDNLNLPQPRQILQNPSRQMPPSGLQQSSSELPGLSQSKMISTGRGGAAVSLPIITHPSQLKDLTEEQRQAILIEEAKRAKRNHKIFLLSKDNGLMTPQDKNFITRIQLQQLMTATGNVNEQDPDVMLSEDFYYQVYNQIESRPRLNPQQPLSNFAQTYLFQTGNRHGGMGRRMNRGGDTHVHRMQQQVQRAVEAAKLKPKGKQLVIEGSLGKISFSNAKTPKPLLNIKRNDSKVPQASLSSTDRKAILKNIEAVYSTLMKMEDHDRRQPPPPADGSDPNTSESLLEWRQVFRDLNLKLWSELKVLDPIVPESTVLHPFIAFLSYPKGKKAIPRIFSQIDAEQRLTILTIIMVQLDTLDVIRFGLPQLSANQSQSAAREQVDLFLQTVMPTLFSYVTKAPLNIVMGLLSLLLDRVNVQAIVHTRVGLELLTMFLSQAEIIRKSEAIDEQDWEQWLSIYNRLFDTIEPILADIFPGSVSAGQDVYVWQFLATVGTGANPEQQQRLVLAVK